MESLFVLVGFCICLLTRRATKFGGDERVEGSTNLFFLLISAKRTRNKKLFG